jgi:hypothetical protein
MAAVPVEAHDTVADRMIVIIADAASSASRREAVGSGPDSDPRLLHVAARVPPPVVGR